MSGGQRSPALGYGSIRFAHDRVVTAWERPSIQTPNRTFNGQIFKAFPSPQSQQLIEDDGFVVVTARDTVRTKALMLANMESLHCPDRQSPQKQNFSSFLMIPTNNNNHDRPLHISAGAATGNSPPIFSSDSAQLQKGQRVPPLIHLNGSGQSNTNGFTEPTPITKMSEFLPPYLDALDINVQEMVVDIANHEFQRIVQGEDLMSSYQSGAQLPTWHFYPSNIIQLSSTDQLTAVLLSIKAKHAHSDFTTHQAIVQAAAAKAITWVIRQTLCRPWFARTKHTLNIASQLSGQSIVRVGDILCTALGTRELGDNEQKVLAWLVNETQQCEQQETPYGRKFCFPWAPTLRIACDLLGFRVDRILEDIQAHDESTTPNTTTFRKDMAPRAFASLCLFFALVRAKILETVEQSPEDYATDLGPFGLRGWIGEHDIRLGTPHFVGPAGHVISIFSPTLEVQGLIRAAIEIVREHPNQMFVRYFFS
eukprot:c24212_g1_i1.p1 GENE.c24212_g1_i1~~c24212_g1_i1.p1  ORF type:complete len:480 (+),score=99.17 c24212_g1_i1:2-1441(+)